MALTNKLASSSVVDPAAAPIRRSRLDLATASRNISSVEQEFQVDEDDEAQVPNGAFAAPGTLPAHGTTAVDRGADLLVRVLESERPVALAELASASGIPKSTASRLVSALERRGLIEQDGTRGRLRPGPAILRVAERGMLERNVVELARPSLDALAEASGETINLAVPARHGVEHVAQVDSRHFLGTGQWLGRVVDYHCTAVGKVFMAFGRATMPAQPLRRHAPATVTDPRRLRAELELVRRHECATAVDELEPGLAAMAAPVRGARGDVVAALSITGPTLRLTPLRIIELQPVLISEARMLSHRLGHSDDEGEHAA
jgi:IclR family transcriptional regulator, acetate operon repressor